MDRTRSTNRTEEECIRDLVANPKRKRPVGRARQYGRIILRHIFNRMAGCRLDYLCSRQGPVIDWCDLGNKRTVAIESGKYLD
jgi:hypothetical protein